MAQPNISPSLSLYSMDRRETSKGSIPLQKKMVENRRKIENNNVPDLTDFMNDMFFGTVDKDKKAYNLSAGDRLMDEEEDFDDSTRSNSSRLTQEWLEEAKRVVASSPSRCDSPSRLVGSPRFAAAQARLSASSIDRRDPLSRSARRHRLVEGFSEEILTKSAKHSRNKSLSLDTSTSPSSGQSPAAAVHKWFSNILNPSSPTSTPPSPTSTRTPFQDPTAVFLPPRQSTPRRSRFQSDNSAPQTQGIPVPSRRTFKTSSAPLPDPTTQLLSPPKNLIEYDHRRSISSSTSSLPLNRPLSPPKNLVESARRRSISKSTCSMDKGAPISNENGWSKEEDRSRDLSLNGFLKEQRIMMEKILNRESNFKAKVVLPGPSNSTSSMVAAICYAWLLENRSRKSKEESDGEKYVVLPVMNVRREKMWKHRQTAWLFHNVGLDATSLLFADEVDLESLMMGGKLSILVVGQDVLRTNGEVGSQCTTLTDNYCEEAYDLLQTTMLKKILVNCTNDPLAGILLDTQNLDTPAPLSITRDAEAVQLLLLAQPQITETLFSINVMQDQRDSSFLEALVYNYGKSPIENGQETRAQLKLRIPERKSTSISKNEASTQNLRKNPNGVTNAKNNKISASPAKTNSLPAQATTTSPAQSVPDTSRGKNVFFLAKWFGFGSK